MKKIFLFVILILLIALFLSRCVISKMRWSDSKARRVFKSKNVPLKIYDTLIEGHRLHYTITGSDSLPSLVFIHGSPGGWIHYSKFMWDGELLKKFRIISFDRPGFGYSDFGNAMHLQEQCKLILPVLQRLKTDQPMFLCGHSLAGAIVAKLAADDPDLFKKVIIVAGSLDPALEKEETLRHIVNARPFHWFIPGAYQPSNTELLYLKDDLKLLANDLKKITGNILFVHSDKDRLVPIENIAYGKKMMVNAASINADILQGTDHRIPLKKPEELKKILLKLE